MSYTGVRYSGVGARLVDRVPRQCVRALVLTRVFTIMLYQIYIYGIPQHITRMREQLSQRAPLGDAHNSILSLVVIATDAKISPRDRDSDEMLDEASNNDHSTPSVPNRMHRWPSTPSATKNRQR